MKQLPQNPFTRDDHVGVAMRRFVVSLGTFGFYVIMWWIMSVEGKTPLWFLLGGAMWAAVVSGVVFGKLLLYWADRHHDDL